MSTWDNEALTSRLTYLLKGTQRLLEDLNNRALAPLGIDSRELGILLAIDSAEPTSQQQLAERLSIDRTTMVALLDSLESKGVISRHPHVDDRRRNIVEITAPGSTIFEDAVQASTRAEHEFLNSLTPRNATILRDSLRTIVSHAPR